MTSHRRDSFDAIFDSPPDAPPDAPPDTPPDAPPDLPPNLPPNLPPSLPPDKPTTVPGAQIEDQTPHQLRPDKPNILLSPAPIETPTSPPPGLLTPTTPPTSPDSDVAPQAKPRPPRLKRLISPLTPPNSPLDCLAQIVTGRSPKVENGNEIVGSEAHKDIQGNEATPPKPSAAPPAPIPPEDTPLDTEKVSQTHKRTDSFDDIFSGPTKLDRPDKLAIPTGDVTVDNVSGTDPLLTPNDTDDIDPLRTPNDTKDKDPLESPTTDSFDDIFAESPPPNNPPPPSPDDPPPPSPDDPPPHPSDDPPPHPSDDPPPHPSYSSPPHPLQSSLSCPPRYFSKTISSDRTRTKVRRNGPSKKKSDFNENKESEEMGGPLSPEHIPPVMSSRRLSRSKSGTSLTVFDDPMNLIYDWIYATTIPVWDAPGAYHNCSCCAEQFPKFSNKHTHNCRLCGRLFCSPCTGKYHIPDNFRMKRGKGAVRVCWECRDKCLEHHKRKDRSWLNPFERLRIARSLSNNRVLFHPATSWARLDLYEKCWCCSTLMAHHYHCRVCGEMFCKPCSSKMKMPGAFKRKKKVGKVRICLECRYYVVKGAVLDPGRSRNRSVPTPRDQISLDFPDSPKAATSKNHKRAFTAMVFARDNDEFLPASLKRMESPPPRLSNDPSFDGSQTVRVLPINAFQPKTFARPFSTMSRNHNRTFSS